MPKEFNQTVRNRFNKGLLTEFSELSFPDEASVDELNCFLYKAGNRSKRLGFNYETNYELSNESYGSSTLFSTKTWDNVGEQPDVEFLVVQAGPFLRFYNKGSDPLSTGAVPISNSNSNPYILDMSSYEKAGGLGAGASHIDVTSTNGVLVVVSPQLEPFYISRSNVDNSFSVTSIDFKIRDFKYFGDPDSRLVEEASPSVGREYDTLNSGWTGDFGTPALTSYQSANSAYPPLTHPWYAGKDSGGNFSESEWRKIYTGTSLSINGHFIIDLFNPDRDAVSGLTDVGYYDAKATNDPSGRFNTVTSYTGRVWYAGEGSRLYYSRILEDLNYIGDCYQQNDPTSEELSDLLATDGGVIRISEANTIRKIHVFGSSLLVFADNGVWRVSGLDANQFDPIGFSVYKITDFGLAYKESFVAGQNAVPFWWSYSGIHTIQVTEQGGFVEVNLSRDTIQTFWNNIGNEEKSFTIGEYDAINNRISWLYPNNGDIIDFKLNNILWLDADLGAFYPWKVSDQETDTNYIVGTSFFDGSGSNEINFNVIDSNGELVVDSSGNEVVVSRVAGNLLSSSIVFLVRNGTTGQISFGTFNDATFYDWGTVDYESYAEAAFNFMGDLGRRKTSPYITVFMKETETGFDITQGFYEPLRESSLKVTALWDFKKTTFTAPQECYRRKRPNVPDLTNLSDFGSPTTVLQTRLKLRGRGRVMKLRFEGQTGKDFNLLGYETLDARNSTY